MWKSAADLRRETYTHLRALQAFTRHLPGGIVHVTQELLCKLERRTMNLRDELQDVKLYGPAQELEDILAIWSLSDLSSHTIQTTIPKAWEMSKLLESMESLFLGVSLFIDECKKRGYEIDQGEGWKAYTHWFDKDSAEHMRKMASATLEDFQRKTRNMENLTSKQLSAVVGVLSQAVADKVRDFPVWFPEHLIAPKEAKNQPPYDLKPEHDSVFGTHHASSLDNIPF